MSLLGQLGGRLQSQEASRSDSPLKVLLAYDYGAYEAALRTYHAVVRRLAPNVEFRDSWWRFDAFSEPKLLERAVDVAAEADVVFCCPNNPHSLPRPVLLWLQRWLARRSQPDGALAVLLPVTSLTSSRQTLLERDLQETARIGGLTFFAAKYVPDCSQLWSADPAKSPSAFGEDLDAIRVVDECGSGVRHWGINE